jgi:hypothetical protein
MNFSRKPAVALLAVGACSAAFGVFAQVPADKPAPPDAVTPPPPDAAPLEEEKIDRFADAYIVIEEIHTQAVADLDSARNPEEASEIRANAEGMIIKAVEQSGLALDEFNQIAELMSVDRGLRERIAKEVAERRRI